MTLVHWEELLQLSADGLCTVLAKKKELSQDLQLLTKDACAGQEDSERGGKESKHHHQGHPTESGLFWWQHLKADIQQTLHNAGFQAPDQGGCHLQIWHTKACVALANAHRDKEDFWSSVLSSDGTKM